MIQRHGKGETMREDGTLSIIRRGETYLVRYASNNPDAADCQPQLCHSEPQMVEFLQYLHVDPWYISQAGVDLRQRGFAGLPVTLDTTLVRAAFVPHSHMHAPEPRVKQGRHLQTHAA